MLKKIKYKKTSQSSLKKSCDELWSKIVQIRAEKKCEICDKKEYLNSHHLISRKVIRYRHDTDNGVCLCSGCHNFNENSPHVFYWNFEKWLKNEKPEQYEDHLKKREDISPIGKVDYQEIYYRLEKEYKELTGEYHMYSRLHQYIMFKNASDINALHIHEEKSVDEIAEKYGISKNAMKKFMTANKII